MIAQEIKHLQEILPEGVGLCAVSKFHPVEALKEAYDAGQRIFGESRVQELEQKVPAMPGDVKWHFIGHLQTNKVKKLISLHPAMIESVDSLRLLEAIDEASRREGVVTRVLLQVHVAMEETKFGFYPSEIKDYFAARGFSSLTNTHICGIMGMASNTDDSERVTADFRAIASLYKEVGGMAGKIGLRGFDTLSMGMSGDWPLAVEQGASLVRIGSAIFGPRQY